ncbi:NLPA lipoprotein [Neisseria lactamica ATCC 23970]|uniref:Lipoprotein n=1 Tax=Neisseria lactamica ATCC 23970 TaxID=546265 RepID=D0W8N2_NEILA|nr:MetQ/NlpA family ABC transporter substrate-binding protein [Neisseria lactamica]EEZ76164.1 NLPA lipoprotein [Neisseria lactamica ATCC 23970]KFJ36154.1 NLPA lipofamily protein [Neisseria lactamica ATCC 23970]VTQ49266.1 outer membrane lipoprotein GNA1946 [Neisseria lactamica]
MKPFFKTLSAAALALILAACGGQKDSTPAASAAAPSADNGAAKKEIVFGTTVGDFGDMVKEQIQPELEKKGYTVKLVEFTDYVRPNLALAEGELDINIFQHKPYLDDFKKEHNLDITEAFQVPTAPLGLYPGKLKSLEEVKDGSTVSAPNDPSNFARALVMLNELGWIKLKDGINPLTASKADIAENLKNIKIVELEAAQLPRSRADVDFAVVNGNYAISSGMKLTEALFQEPSFAYVNWSAVKTADKDSQWLKDVTEAYNSDAFKAYAHKRFEGYKYPAAWNEGAAK